jgi:hypothetical protein
MHSTTLFLKEGVENLQSDEYRLQVHSVRKKSRRSGASKNEQAYTS